MASVKSIGAVWAVVLVTALGGCYPSSYRRNSPNNYDPSPVYRNNNYHSERGAWRENAHTSPSVFSHSGQIERHIQEETRGANFNDADDRRAAAIRANQIREQAWRAQHAQREAAMRRASEAASRRNAARRR